MHRSEKKPVNSATKRKVLLEKYVKGAKIWDPNTVHVVHRFYLEFGIFLNIVLNCFATEGFRKPCMKLFYVLLSLFIMYLVALQVAVQSCFCA